MLNSFIGVLLAVAAYFYFQNKKLKSKILDSDLKNEKEKLDEQQKKTDGSRNRFLDLLEKYRKGE